MSKRRRSARAFLLGALAVAGAACGGSDGVPPYGAFLLDGKWSAVEMRTTLSGFSSTTVLSALGTANGSSSLGLSSVLQNMDATISAGADDAGTFTVDGFGFTTVQGLAVPYRGGIDLGGRCVLLASNAAGNGPAILAMLRRTGTYSAATFSGTYHVGYAVENTTAWGTAMADGMGGGTVGPVVENAGGSVGALAAGAMTYTVAPAGQFDTSFGVLQARGGISSDGSHALLAGDLAAGDGSLAPHLFAYVRAATTASNATFSGDYWAVSVLWNGTEAASRFGLLQPAGNGTMAAEFDVNVEGTLGNTGIDTSTTYSVAANGLLLVQPGGGSDELQGAISADGFFGFVAGETAGGDREFVVFCRRR